MKKIEIEKLDKRWDGLSDVLREAVFSDENDNNLEEISKKFHLSDLKHRDLAYLCLVVFLGFSRLDDFYNRVKENLQIDSRVALEIYQEVDKKIFSQFKKEIEENYLKFKSENQKEEDSQIQETIPKESQVVLKGDIEEVVNLKKEEPRPIIIKAKEEVPIAQKREFIPSQVIKPLSQPVFQETKTARPSLPQNQNVFYKKEEENILPKKPESSTIKIVDFSFAPKKPDAGEAKSEISQNGFVGGEIGGRNNFGGSFIKESLPTQNIFSTKSGFKKDLTDNLNKNEDTQIPNSPIIIHRIDKSESISQGKDDVGFKYMSFGASEGSFDRAPKVESSSYKAQVEVPFSSDSRAGGDGNIPLKVKKFDSDQPKTVHYSTLKTELEKRPEGKKGFFDFLSKEQQ